MEGLLGIVSELSEENGHMSALISLFLPEAGKAGETRICQMLYDV